MNSIRHGLGVTAVIGGLVLGRFAVTLAGLGMFCFDGALFAELSDRTSLAPDCFVIGVSDWVNPRLWLLANLFIAIVLSIWAHVIAYGLLRSRSWGRTSSSVGAFAGIFYFLEIATALPEFRISSIVGVTALACFTLGCLVVLKPGTPA
jgi:hypothetical protein